MGSGQRSADARPTAPACSKGLQRAGFATAAFVSSVVVDRQSGLQRGFGYYGDQFAPNTFRKPGDAVVAEAGAWLKSQRHFFAWVKIYDLHAP
jgi:hypothetical protein